MTDEQLISGYASGERELFAVIVNRFQGRLLPWLFKYLRDWNSAQDALQETWLRLHLKCRTYRGESAFGTWLFTIARNVAVSLFNRKRCGHSAGDMESLIDHRLPVDEQLEQADCQRVLLAIKRLPAIYRDTILAVDIDQVKYEVAARHLGCAVGTIRSRRHRGIILLKAELANENSDD